MSAGYSWEMAFRSGDIFSSLISEPDITTYDVSNNRDDVFKEILTDVEELTKYGSSSKIKKR